MNAIYAFFNTNGFALELMLASALCALWHARRENFTLRVLAGALVMLAASTAFEALFSRGAATMIARCVMLHALCALGIGFCFRVSAGEALFSMTAAGALQHFSFCAARLCCYLLLPAFGSRAFVYGYPVFVVPCMALCHALVSRRLRGEGGVQRREVLLLLAGMLLYVNVFQNLFDAFSDGMGDKAYTVYVLFDMLASLFLLSLQCSIVRRESAEQQSAVLRQLLHQQRRQMEVSRETIELINIKCHDIKHQISRLSGRITPGEAENLNRLVDIYDGMTQTGSEALDILLAEKSLLCGQRGIRFECMADGARLSFMDPGDVYALFGNAMDNAIEAVEKLAGDGGPGDGGPGDGGPGDGGGERAIALRVFERKGMLLIHIENPCAQEPVYADGLPQTTKGDTRYHGFGMKSIRMIAEKYGGSMSAGAKDGLFTLNLLLPIPDEKGKQFMREK